MHRNSKQCRLQNATHKQKDNRILVLDTHMDNLCIGLVSTYALLTSSVIAVILLMNTHLNTPQTNYFANFNHLLCVSGS